MFNHSQVIDLTNKYIHKTNKQIVENINLALLCYTSGELIDFYCIILHHTLTYIFGYIYFHYFTLYLFNM